MAVNNDDAEISWWDWAVITKEKVLVQSTEVLGFVKNDIDEFTKVISQEVSTAVSSTATILQEKLNLEEHVGANQMKQSISGFFNHVAEAFSPMPDDSDVEAIMICNQQPVFLDKAEAAAYQLYSDHSYFVKEIDVDEKGYKSWLQKFNIEDHKDELSELLLNIEMLRRTYTNLVPIQVSHDVFWHRYFYKSHKIKEAQNKRDKMKLRMENSTDEDHQTLWDEDEKFGGDVEIPERVQNKLLEEYQRERDNKLHENDASVPDQSPFRESNDNYIEELPKEQKSSSPVSSKDTDESWDKLQNLETELQNTSSSESIKEQCSNKNEDWENWE